MFDVNAVDYILDGLAAELELERELGVRMVEFDRSLLVTAKEVARPRPRDASEQSGNQTVSRPNNRTPEHPNTRTFLSFAFLHHQPLSPKGVEMMAKIITAMGKTVETAPVIVAPPLPKARVYVVLGGLALKTYFPSLRGAPGQWLKAEGGEDVLVTYSPEYILRFGMVTPAVKKMKQDMWTSLKAVVQRTR